MDITVGTQGHITATGVCVTRQLSRGWEITRAVITGFGVLFVGGLLALPIHASALDAFTKVSLPTGISLDIPSHWQVLSLETRENLTARGAAISAGAGMAEEEGVKTNLLAVNAEPYPTGSTIRVSITTRPEFTAADLLSATPTDLEQIGQQVLADFKKGEKAGAPHIVSMAKPTVAMLAGHPTVIFAYLRSGAVNASEQWNVVQYRSPLPDRLVQVTVSWRASEALLFKPILSHVIASVIF